MLQITLNEKAFQINNIDFQFPVNIHALKGVLGDFRHTKKEHNNIYTWDEYGVLAYSKNGTWVEVITLIIGEKGFEFSPAKMFKDRFLINEQDVFDYYENNKDRRFKLFVGDSGGAFAINNVRVWFYKNPVNQNIEAIQIDAYISPEASMPLTVDEKYTHFITIWEEWVNETTKIVQANNPYYNLTHGITQVDVEKNVLLDPTNNITVPDLLINFYKIYNVEYNGVTSPFSFFLHNWKYDLLPFEKIKKDWESIQLLNDEDNDISDLVSEYDKKVKADNYANPGWIPFAEGYNGDYLLFDTDPSLKGQYGQIIELQNESWYRGVIANSLEELLQNEINAIKEGDTEKFDFITSNEE